MSSSEHYSESPCTITRVSITIISTNTWTKSEKIKSLCLIFILLLKKIVCCQGLKLKSFSSKCLQTHWKTLWKIFLITGEAVFKIFKTFKERYRDSYNGSIQRSRYWKKWYHNPSFTIYRTTIRISLIIGNFNHFMNLVKWIITLSYFEMFRKTK